MRPILFVITFLFAGLSGSSQTLIMNEVSQGVSGSMEYVEFVVVDTQAVYNCGLTVPPSIDIRGWIFDDNSGYHGTGGIAVGAVRFSYDPLWSAVPLGTIILIYNDASPEPSIPAVDLSLSDGNCSIIAPISSPTLFESNSTTPGAIACSYPASGWTPGGSWSNTLLANSGDCARIVNLSGCEVFSVCYGDVNLNTEIYFAAGAELPADHRNTVYYFTNGDPTVQSNWAIGCTDNETILDANQCGANYQTPGLPNNPLNQAYIAQFNNNCTPITPVTAVVSVVQNEVCGCDGQASVSASGSIPGYTYDWQDGSGNSIGQSGSSATGLCAGTYHVLVTSSIGCTDLQSVTINSATSFTVTASNSGPICSGDTLSLTASGSSAVSWSWSSNGSASIISPAGQLSDAIQVSDGEIFTVTAISSSGCTATAQTIAVVYSLPTASISGGGSFCNPPPNAVNVFLTISDGTPNYTLTYTYNGVSETYNTSSAEVVYLTSSGTYELISISDAHCSNELSGSATLEITYNVTPPVVVDGDTNYYLGDPLNPMTVVPNGTTLWFNDQLGSDTLEIGESFVPFAQIGSTTYYVQQSVNNCPGIPGAVTIQIEPCNIIIPTAFTPDGDKTNDFWEILNLDEIYPSNTVVVYNRWGTKLYESTQGAYAVTPWNGQYAGKSLPVGSYYYIIDPQVDGKDVFKGIVSIVKE